MNERIGSIQSKQADYYNYFTIAGYYHPKLLLRWRKTWANLFIKNGHSIRAITIT